MIHHCYILLVSLIIRPFIEKGPRGSGGKCYGTNVFEGNLVNSTSDIAFEIAAI